MAVGTGGAAAVRRTDFEWVGHGTAAGQLVVRCPRSGDQPDPGCASAARASNQRQQRGRRSPHRRWRVNRL